MYWIIVFIIAFYIDDRVSEINSRHEEEIDSLSETFGSSD